MSPQYSPVRLEYDRLDPDEALARSREFTETGAGSLTRHDCVRRSSVAMEARRSAAFSPEPVPRELIDNALTVAGTAPSGAHQQPWTFALVSDPATKAKLREAAEKEERDFYERRATDEWKEAIEPIGPDWVKSAYPFALSHEETPLFVVAEQLPQLRDVHTNDLGDRPRRVVRPECGDDRVERDDLVAPDEQQGEQRALLR